MFVTVVDDDLVFKALADPGRRALLDALRDRDGQTLAALCAVLPEMTRFGVMKHLGMLEQAGLVVTHRDGRAKRHHLNPVPIREVHDRWISRYAASGPRGGRATPSPAARRGGREDPTTTGSGTRSR